MTSTKIPVQDRVGKKFSRLTILEILKEDSPERMVRCSCECGKEVVKRFSDVVYLKIKSCGCGRRRICKLYPTAISLTKEYRSWENMKDRCFKAKDKQYHNYGGRGITVCERWINNPELFIEDVGLAPSSKHSIDRIDNNGNYEPGNVRWATNKEQARNRRRTVINQEIANEIRRLRASGVKRRFIRKQLGVSRDIVAQVLCGRTWS